MDAVSSCALYSTLTITLKVGTHRFLIAEIIIEGIFDIKPGPALLRLVKSGGFCELWPFYLKRQNPQIFNELRLVSKWID